MAEFNGEFTRTPQSRFAYQEVQLSPNIEYYLEYEYAIKKNENKNPLGGSRIVGEVLNGFYEDGRDAFDVTKQGKPLLRTVGKQVKGKGNFVKVMQKFKAPSTGDVTLWFYAVTSVDVYLDNVKVHPVHQMVMVNAPDVTLNEVTQKKLKKKKKRKKRKKVKLPEIDLSHWKVTTPELNRKNRPVTVKPPQILDYATDQRLMPYMYNDSVKGALVFHAFPTKATTRNTKYSRSELRELMDPKDDHKNWKFSEGAYLKAKIQVDEVSLAKKGKYKYSRMVVLQIHGRLTNEQRDLLGQDDHNAPPILKVYWQDGKIKLSTKELKFPQLGGAQILHKDAWANASYTFKEKVGFKKFVVEIKVSKGKMVVALNGVYKVYEDIHMQKWDVFENYFKAGNYFQSREEGSYGRVRFYELEVKH